MGRNSVALTRARRSSSEIAWEDFATAGDARTFMNHRYGDQTNALTAEQRHGLNTWTGTFYSYISNYLRHGQTDINRETLDDLIGVMDQAFAQPAAVLRHNLRVRRQFDPELIATLRPGQVLTERSFMATTVGPDSNYNAIILAPANTRAVWVAPVSKMSFENELLFDRDTSLRVLSAGPMPVLQVIGQAAHAY